MDRRRAFEDCSDSFREHCRETYGRDWNDYEPAYRWAFDAGRHDDYRDREFEQVEADLRREYEARHGRGGFDRVKAAVRRAYGEAKMGLGAGQG